MTTTAERLFTTWITSLDRVDHAVTDEECAARLAEARGSFRAVCGLAFLPGAMEEEPQPPCRRCVARLHTRVEKQTEVEEPAASGWISRLFCRREQPDTNARSDDTQHETERRHE